MLSVLYSIKVNINGSQVIKHFFHYKETSLRVLVVLRLQVLLSVITRIIEQVKHFIFLILVIVSINLEFALDLELLVKER
jgi:hypothetical protein